MQALQVEPVAPSLNSSYCYNDSSVFTWTGNLTTSEDQELMERQLDLIKPNTQSKPQKEGESDPHLFSCIFSKGNLKTYLSAVEFREKFGMAKDVFYNFSFSSLLLRLKRTNLVSQEFKRDRDRCSFSSFCPQEACFLG
ncbi:hypothetical protein OIU85_000787 [Salix viminalis]|uniref:Uncharacterized protein n=1 Tax=Salix viminalis TaxID=40686 RepID=A0A9Q0VJU6_SALVM|nr:hypothetical protein OIU85_000787 [Salix viminalis]